MFQKFQEPLCHTPRFRQLLQESCRTGPIDPCPRWLTNSYDAAMTLDDLRWPWHQISSAVVSQAPSQSSNLQRPNFAQTTQNFKLQTQRNWCMRPDSVCIIRRQDSCVLPVVSLVAIQTFDFEHTSAVLQSSQWMMFGSKLALNTPLSMVPPKDSRD